VDKSEVKEASPEILDDTSEDISVDNNVANELSPDILADCSTDISEIKTDSSVLIKPVTHS
jgi:hypothetical protein